MTSESCDCPHCGEGCDRESVDVGVGVIHGPWGCAGCGWSSDSRYDSRAGVRRDGADRVYDQYGVRHGNAPDPIDVVVAGVNVHDRGAGQT